MWVDATSCKGQWQPTEYIENFFVDTLKSQKQVAGVAARMERTGGKMTFKDFKR